MTDLLSPEAVSSHLSVNRLASLGDFAFKAPDAHCILHWARGCASGSIQASRAIPDGVFPSISFCIILWATFGVSFLLATYTKWIGFSRLIRTVEKDI